MHQGVGRSKGLQNTTDFSLALNVRAPPHQSTLERVYLEGQDILYNTQATSVDMHKNTANQLDMGIMYIFLNK